MTLNIDGQLWTVVEFQHVKPGKGGAFVRSKLKNVLSGKVVDRTFNAGVKVDVATVDRREMQYLYREGDDFVFMDTQDYDQPRIPGDTVGGAASYLLEDQTAVVAFNEGTPLYVELPAAVELTVSQTDPGVQGDRSTGGTKPATLETGAQVQVPLFISTGEKVRVDTRTGEYISRAYPAASPAAGQHSQDSPGPCPHAARHASAPSMCSTRPSCGVSRCCSCSTSGSPTPARRSRRTRPSWSAASSSTGSASTSCWPRTPWTGRWTGCPPWTAMSCGSARTSCCGRPMCRTAWRSARPCSWPGLSPPRPP